MAFLRRFGLVVCLEAIFVFLTFALSFCGGFFTGFNLVKCSGICFLFGKIYEVKRQVVGGNMFWCNFCVLSGLFSCVACVLLWKRKIPYLCLNRKSMLILCGINAVLMLISSLIIDIGFNMWCDTFLVASCQHKHVYNIIDWKMFEPKYTNGFRSSQFFYLSSVFCKMSSVSSCLLAVFYRLIIKIPETCLVYEPHISPRMFIRHSEDEERRSPPEGPYSY